MFNWMLGQLRKAVWRSSVREKALNLNRLSSTRKNQKPRPQPNSVIRAIPSHVYVQLDARPVKEGCRKVVCSWKGSEFESAEQCEEERSSYYLENRSRSAAIAIYFKIIIRINRAIV